MVEEGSAANATIISSTASALASPALGETAAMGPRQSIAFPRGAWLAHEAITDCGSMGMGCVLADPTKEAMCVPVVGACNPTQDRAYCTGGDINLCVLNQWWTVSCSSISASGRCALGAGVNGEAACL